MQKLLSIAIFAVFSLLATNEANAGKSEDLVIGDAAPCLHQTFDGRLSFLSAVEAAEVNQPILAFIEEAGEDGFSPEDVETLTILTNTAAEEMVRLTETGSWHCQNILLNGVPHGSSRMLKPEEFSVANATLKAFKDVVVVNSGFDSIDRNFHRVNWLLIQHTELMIKRMTWMFTSRTTS